MTQLSMVRSEAEYMRIIERALTGTVLAVQRAHDSLALGTLSLGNTTILDTNINRSPFAYEANPAEERARLVPTVVFSQTSTSSSILS
jgi:neutral ceramidase